MTGNPQASTPLWVLKSFESESAIKRVFSLQVLKVQTTDFSDTFQLVCFSEVLSLLFAFLWRWLPCPSNWFQTVIRVRNTAKRRTESVKMYFSMKHETLLKKNNSCNARNTLCKDKSKPCSVIVDVHHIIKKRCEGRTSEPQCNEQYQGARDNKQGQEKSKETKGHFNWLFKPCNSQSQSWHENILAS